MLGTHFEPHRGQMSHICDISALRVKFIYMFVFIDTQDFRFPLGMNPSKLLINDIESLQKGMDVKELGMTRELQAKEIQTKTFQSMNIETTHLELSDILLCIH